MVELFVGEEKILFRVHKEVLCQVDVFSRMFNGGSEEGTSGHAHFPDDDPLAFKWFLEWIYLDDTSSLSEDNSLMQRIKLYCPASKYRTTALMDKLMDSIHMSVRENRELLNASAINYLYTNCVGKCCLKLFIEDIIVHVIVDEDEENHRHEKEHSLSIERLAKAYARS